MVKDPYRYFRIEAQELLDGLHEGLLALEKGPDREVVRRLLRQAHTFKGAARVVKLTDIGDRAHAIEDLLSPHRQSDEPVARKSIDTALGLLDEVRSIVATLSHGSPSVEAERARPKAADDNLEVIRVPVREVDALLEAAFEAHTAAAVLGREAARIGQAAERARGLGGVASSRVGSALESLVAELDELHRSVRDRTDRLVGELGELRAAASELRLVSAGVLSTELERAARDAAHTLDKDVSLSFTGERTRLDAHVLAGLRGALAHVVRNSVAHGIEDRGTRERSGKPPAGRIDITVERRGHRVAVRCVDDGRGLDVAEVRRVAVERHLVTAVLAEAMDEAALARLLLAGGVSTSRTVTRISGRGVGLDAVRHAVEALEGEVVIESRAGVGTTVEILVPVSLSSLPALSIDVDDTAVLVPLDSVRRALRVNRTDVLRDAAGERIVVDGRVVPFLPLRSVLGRGRSVRQEVESVVVIEAEGQVAALGVDRVGGARSVVVRGLPRHAAIDPIVSGAALDEDGIPRPVLAPLALIRAAARARPHHETPAAASPPPLLVIDDSLTTRMLEQSILESAGYEVDLATSGEDGIDKARQRQYGAFIVDVEMPGMSGFEFIEATRADPKLRGVPAILVTSRGDPEDKRRGKEAGARAYLVKSEFDQAELLEAIRRLTR